MRDLIDQTQSHLTRARCLLLSTLLFALLFVWVVVVVTLN